MISDEQFVQQSNKTHKLSGGSEYIPSVNYTRALKLEQKTISIGRETSNDIVLDHPMVSRLHAKIVSVSGKHVIYDLGSTNGTYLNGAKVIDSSELIADSIVQICGFRFIFDGQTLIEYDESSGQVRVEIRGINKDVRLPNGENRRLLEGLNLVIEPCELVAILGGSGAGKSTLMGALTGIKPATSGEILINGRRFYQEYEVFRSMIGYVPLELTVRQVLTYSALLRMPDDTTPTEIDMAVDKAMADLELSSRADVLVKNLSGGQRKRVSIGVELLTRPSLFFLDEPTSGLDPGLEKTMMEMFHDIANRGRTIILTTHATFNINLCDKVIFLAEGGRLAFFGTPAEALEYFGAADFADIYKKVSLEKSAPEWASEYEKSSFFQNTLINNSLVLYPMLRQT